MTEDQKDKEKLSTLDLEFVRVLEDLIDTLLANGTIRLTDLPSGAIKKLGERKTVRSRLRETLDLINDNDEEEGLL